MRDQIAGINVPIETSARKLVLVILVSVFVADLGVMFAFTVLPPIGIVPEAILDALVLTVLVFPLVYRFQFKPLLRLIAQESEARAKLDELNRDLERTVAERTQKLTDVNRQLLGEVEERRRSEAQLERNRDLMLRVLEASSSLVFIYDLEHGRCDYSNDRIGDLLGFDPGAVYAMGSGFGQTVLDQEAVARLLKPGGALAEAADGDVVEVPLWLADDSGERWLFECQMVVSRAEGDIRPRSVVCIATPRRWRKTDEPNTEIGNGRRVGDSPSAEDDELS